MILIPAFLAFSSGAIMALGSVIEIMMASGLVATTAFSTAVCLSTANVASPCVSKVAPSRLASSAAPQDTDE